MPLLTAKVKSWKCEDAECPFSWQFSGEALGQSPYDLTSVQLKKQFPERPFIGLQPGYCPNCWTHGQFSKLYREDQEDALSEVVVANDEELEAKAEDEQISTQGLADLKLQRDQNLDQLETITVQEVTP